MILSDSESSMEVDEKALRNVSIIDVNLYHHYLNEHPELNIRMTDNEVKSNILKIKSDNKACGWCGTQEYKLYRCAKCCLNYYCSKDHQRKHWSSHKERCCNTDKMSDIDFNSIIRFDNDDWEIKIGSTYRNIGNINQMQQDVSNYITHLSNSNYLKQLFVRRYPERLPGKASLIMYPSLTALHRAMYNNSGKPIIEFKSKDEACKMFDIEVIEDLNDTNSVLILCVILNSRFNVEPLRLKALLAIKVNY